MAIYRNIQTAFWTDSKVVDDFTPEDRFFYLYLLTNPHTNLSGCYELSLKQASDETGYTKEVIENLLVRFEEVHNIIRFSRVTKEVLILNWSKFNWTKSKDFQKPLIKEIKSIKNLDFRGFLENELSLFGTVLTPSQDGVGTTVTVTVTDTDTVKKEKGGVGEKTKPSMLKTEFEKLWSLYPRKQGKDKAYGYYERARKDGTTYEEVEQGILAYKEYISANEIDIRYVKQGATFFSQKAWQDDWSIREEQNIVNKKPNGTVFGANGSGKGQINSRPCDVPPPGFRFPDVPSVDYDEEP